MAGRLIVLAPLATGGAALLAARRRRTAAHASQNGGSRQASQFRRELDRT
jgi:hypothetical protein